MIFSQFMVDTRNGLIGLSVAGHVMEEPKIVIVHASTPCPQTEEKTAADWDELKGQESVTHISAQVNEFCYLERNVIMHEKVILNNCSPKAR